MFVRGDESTRAKAGVSDAMRAFALLAAMILQTVAGAIGGSGAWGEPVGSVARAYPTILLPGGTAFSIWSLIYVLGIALAVRAVLPRQRRRDVQRSVGWWLVAAGMLNAAWVVAFTQRGFVPAQVIIVALLVVLCVALARLAARPAEGWADRLLLHTPVGIYAGWVTVATVTGAATTGAALGVTFSSTVATILAVVVALGAAAIAALATVRLRPVVGFAAAVAWGLGWIAVETPSGAVSAATAVGAVAVLLTTVWSLRRDADETRTARG
ncbi:hypothetical protein SacglDRAFT_03023 [Saccharomonospora glauca K62]|uniref:Tryptophan-rich sensory protein n=1 Tax=Saccharomonospora glauca K62 TaxID=928724 RepID=I1D4L7_9PSEU|nr:hypothetical protein SacglDRAFT_03023 [Saccharomonospora glauca K62]